MLNMIAGASQSDTAHIMVPGEMTPRAKGYDSDEDSAAVVQKGPDMISARS